MEELDIENLTDIELHLIHLSIVEKWSEEKLKSEYLTPQFIQLRIRNNKANKGIIEW